MKTVNYMQVIKDSQFYTEIDMIITLLKHIRHYLSDEVKKNFVDENGITHIELQSPKSRLDYIIKGLENTKEQGYKITKINE